MPLTKKKRNIDVALLMLTFLLDEGGWSAQSPPRFSQWTEPQYPF